MIFFIKTRSKAWTSSKMAAIRAGDDLTSLTF